MGIKSYLQEQVYLVGLNSYDLFTDDEFDAYMQIVEAKNELDKLDEEEAPEEEKKIWIDRKKKAQQELNKLIAEQEHVPRTVRLRNLIYWPKDSEEEFPAGLTWKTLKFSKKISEFSSEMTRAMGLKHMDYTLDQIIVKWKSLDVMRQIVLNGIYIPILHHDGEVENRHYRFLTASAGQLRRDKLQLISDVMWDKIKKRIECGLSWDVINEKSGVNVNKYLAYLALAGSATDEWTDFDIDRCIVIPEFQGEVTDRMMYIKSDYSHKEEICTVKIDHTDGCGMILPCVSRSNFMVRIAWVKGLLASFDFIRFCSVNGVKPVIKDIYGLEHDLIKENIQIIFTESQFKMWKYFGSWDAYKKAFKECDARAGKTNYEEEEIEDASINYQFIRRMPYAVTHIENVVNQHMLGVA